MEPNDIPMTHPTAYPTALIDDFPICNFDMK